VTPPTAPPPPDEPNTLELLQRHTEKALQAWTTFFSTTHTGGSFLLNGLGSPDSSRLRRKGDARPDEAYLRHRCRFCGKVFGSDSALQIHIRSHTGERPFKCNVCGNRFSTKGNLKVHFQRHRAKYPHVRMNPNPVPEHLDKHFPPLEPPGDRSPSSPPPPPQPCAGMPIAGAPQTCRVSCKNNCGFSGDTLDSKWPILAILWSGSGSLHTVTLSPGPCRRHRGATTRRASAASPTRGPGARRPATAPPTGFSINKQVAVENLAELSYISQRVICEAVKSHGGLLNVPISKELKASVRQARHRYAAYLDEQKKQALSRQAASKRKELEQELDKMHGRKSKLQKTLKCLLESADRFSEEAEAKNDLTYLVKANSFRRTAKEKELEIASQRSERTPFPMAQEDRCSDDEHDSGSSAEDYPGGFLAGGSGTNDNSWETLMEVTRPSETSKLQQLVDNIEHKLSDPNQCVICHRVLSCRSALQMHYRTHTGERPFRCKICGRAFTTKGNLKTHMGVHRVKPPLRVLHKCPVCHKQFTNSLVLQQHVRMHGADTAALRQLQGPPPTGDEPTPSKASSPQPCSSQPASPPPQSDPERKSASPPQPPPPQQQQPLLRPLSPERPPSQLTSLAALENQVTGTRHVPASPSACFRALVRQLHVLPAVWRKILPHKCQLARHPHWIATSMELVRLLRDTERKHRFTDRISSPLRSQETQYFQTNTHSLCTGSGGVGPCCRPRQGGNRGFLFSRSFDVKGIKTSLQTPALPFGPFGLGLAAGFGRFEDQPLFLGRGADTGGQRSPGFSPRASSELSTGDERSSPPSPPTSPPVNGAPLDLTPRSLRPGDSFPGRLFAAAPLGGLPFPGAAPGRPNTTCQICFKTFACNSALEIHYRSHTKERPFKCSVCERGFSTKGNLKQHMLTHKIRDLPATLFAASSASGGPSPQPAPSPGRPPSPVEQPRPDEASRGKRAGTPSPAPRRPPGLPRHVCQVCHKPFSSSSSLQIHMRTHTGDRPFKCSVCGRAFTTKGNLKVHMGTHMWNNGSSRRGRRMSIELPALLGPPKSAPPSGMPDFGAPPPPHDLFYPYLGPAYLNGMLGPKANEVSVIQGGQEPRPGDEAEPHNGAWAWKMACNLCAKICGSSLELEAHLKAHHRKE
ncbi:unnamed protein product, partial [Ixodes hexagonus]